MKRVTLRRLQTQDEGVNKRHARSSSQKRSRSEDMHMNVIRELCPGWTVRHEPMCACNFDLPLVVGGARNPWASGEYTVDYIASMGVKRICFESKSSLSDAQTLEALEKCRHLRDETLTRVLTLAGHGADLRVIDFGDPGTIGEQVYSLDAAKAALSGVRVDGRSF